MAKILIVDDTTLARRLIRMTFELGGNCPHTFMEAKDGAEGLRKALEEKPDLVITDEKMPELSGLEMISKIREESQVPIIWRTSFIPTVPPPFADQYPGTYTAVLSKAADLPVFKQTVADGLAFSPTQSAEAHAEILQKPTRILVVDDEAEERAEVKRILEEGLSGPVEFTEADDGVPALKLVRQQPFDLIVTDKSMKGLNGIAFVVEAFTEGDEKVEPTPVIMRCKCYGNAGDNMRTLQTISRLYRRDIPEDFFGVVDKSAPDSEAQLLTTATEMLAAKAQSIQPHGASPERTASLVTDGKAAASAPDAPVLGPDPKSIC